VTAPPGSDPRPIAVLDLDGVLAGVDHRLQHLRRRPKDWGAFFATMADDPLLPEGFAVATELARRHRIVYLTGRPERYRDVTEQWLRRHDLPDGPVLHRGDGDGRPARVLKPELVRRLATTARVAVVVDDDVGVLDALREGGVTVFHADWATSAAVLRDAQAAGET